MKIKKLGLIAICCILFNVSCIQDNTGTKAEKQGWHLSMQSYTFHLFTVIESLDKSKELGLRFIEIYPGQRLGERFGEATFEYQMSSDEQDRLKEEAASRGIKIISSGVWTAQSEEWEYIFPFANNMGMEFISAEPAHEDWDVVEALAKKYHIKVAVHNHPNENSYWKPEILLEYIGNRDILLGSNADVGHFKRMEIDPILALGQLESRLVAMHFKDVAPQGPEGILEDVVWGTGVLNVKGILQELKRQNFNGYFTIEYEANWENNLPEIKQSIDYFNQVVDEIL